jgi:hypothetical protein
MNTGLPKIAVGRAEKEQRSLERWEKIRANGKAQFVLTIALSYTGLMILGRGISEYLFDGNVMVSYIGRILIDLVIGMIAGGWAWSSREREYRNQLLVNPLTSSRNKTLPSS